jgi:hypothetical protein
MITADHHGRRAVAWSEIQGCMPMRSPPGVRTGWRIISTMVSYTWEQDQQYPHRGVNDFIQRFCSTARTGWTCVSSMCELVRSGDLFVLLFRSAIDGMSFIRFVTKDQIQKIETSQNDWETELVYWEAPAPGELDPRRWLSPEHPEAGMTDAIMLHYTVNRPMGALMGESDLTTIIPWLLRYSRMLEDRVRLHWAARAFLYLVTVPSNKVEAKSTQYGSAPESGSIVVKDESETWETITLSLRRRQPRYEGSPVTCRRRLRLSHWRGEGGEST